MNRKEKVDDLIAKELSSYIKEYNKMVDSKPVSNDLTEAADKHVENWYKENNLDVEDYPIDVKISKEDFIAGAQWQKKQIINKACSWLKENAVDYIVYVISEERDCLEIDRLLDNFKKALDK